MTCSWCSLPVSRRAILLNVACIQKIASSRLTYFRYRPNAVIPTEGSVISLKIGARTLRRKPVNNPHLTDLVRRYESAYSLMLWCPWRVMVRK